MEHYFVKQRYSAEKRYLIIKVILTTHLHDINPRHSQSVCNYTR